MGQLVELIFEGQEADAAFRLVDDILSRSTGVMQASLDGERCDPETALSELLPGLHTATVLMLRSVDLPRIGHIPGVSIRLLRVGKLVDVELGIDLDKVVDPSQLSEALFILAGELAGRHSASSYFAGLEPAVDEETRIFTGRKKGPFWFPGSHS